MKLLWNGKTFVQVTMGKFPFYQQLDAMDCGPTCLRMIAKHYGKHYSLETLRQKCFIGREGVSLLGISTAAEGIGFRTVGVHISFQQLCEAPLPCIVHWKQNHFVVVYKIDVKTRGSVETLRATSLQQQASPYAGTVHVADPAQGLIKFLLNPHHPPSDFLRKSRFPMGQSSPCNYVTV